MCVTECLFLCLGFVFGTEVLRVSELAIRFSGVQWFGLSVDEVLLVWRSCVYWYCAWYCVGCCVMVCCVMVCCVVVCCVILCDGSCVMVCCDMLCDGMLCGGML